MRDKTLEINDLLDGTEILSCYVALNEKSLDQQEFTKLVNSLNPHGVITKPLIGDVFKCEGVFNGTRVMNEREV